MLEVLVLGNIQEHLYHVCTGNSKVKVGHASKGGVEGPNWGPAELQDTGGGGKSGQAAEVVAVLVPDDGNIWKREREKVGWRSGSSRSQQRHLKS